MKVYGVFKKFEEKGAPTEPTSKAPKPHPMATTAISPGPMDETTVSMFILSNAFFSPRVFFLCRSTMRKEFSMTLSKERKKRAPSGEEKTKNLSATTRAHDGVFGDGMLYYSQINYALNESLIFYIF